MANATASENLKEIALVNGDVYEVGWGAPDVPGSTVVRIVRFKSHGSVQVVVRLSDGREMHQLYRATDVAQGWGSDDPDLHEW